MYVLADLLKELKGKKAAGKIDPEIKFPNSITGETNISDYIYYMYNGQHGQLTQGTATPSDSARIKRVKKYMSYFTIGPR